jgi:hypothetical protein
MCFGGVSADGGSSHSISRYSLPSTFVGYLAGGLGGGLAMTIGIFLPAFVFPIFIHRCSPWQPSSP